MDRHRPGAAGRRVIAALRRGLLLVALATASACPGPAPALAPHAPTKALFDHTHGAFDALLARHVADGRVDYAGLAADRAALDAYVAALAGPSFEEAASWTHAERVAFWINAYNALTLRVVLDHMPVDSIRSIGLLPYAAFRQPVVTVRNRTPASGTAAPGAASPDPSATPAGAPLTLDDIEKRILLGELDEVRIHFAISCASASCPALQSRAWRAADLDASLDAAARAFLADPSKNRWDPATRTLALSKIFEWYEADFTRAAGSVPAFVARYAPAEMAAGIAAGGATVRHLDYDWSLNAR